MATSPDTVPVARLQPPKRGVAVLSRHLSVVRWNDGTTSFADRPTVERYARNHERLFGGNAVMGLA